MKHRNLLLGVLLPLPFLLAPTCMEQLLAPRIEFRTEHLFELSPDGSMAVGVGSDVQIWKNGAMVELPQPPDLWPLDVSYDGRVIVGYGAIDGYWGYPVRWKDGVIVSLWQHGPWDPEASDVSWDGEVVVGTVHDPDLPASGVMWVGDTLIPLTTEDGFRADTAEAVSADGETIVGWGRDASGHESRYLWRDGEVTWIPGLEGHPAWYPRMQLSDDGTTVVDSEHPPDWCCGDRAFRWRDGVRELLPVPDDASNPRMNANAISGNGEIIVGDSSGPDGYHVATIWDSTHGARTVEALLLELGLELPEGMHLDTTWDISSSGQRILGSAYLGRPYVDSMSFIVTLPPACADHLDNDGDGLTDLREDDGCRSKFDASEEHAS